MRCREHIAPSASGIFRRTRLRSNNANGVCSRCVKCEDFLYTDVMLPVVAEIIHVFEPFVSLEAKVRESNLIGIIGEADAAFVSDTILLSVNDKLVQMALCPTHDDLHGFVKCPDGRVTRNQDAFEPHAVIGIHLVVPLLEPREQVEQEIRRSLGTSSLPRRLQQTVFLKSPLPYFGGTGTSPSSAFFHAAAASLRRVRLVSRNGGLVHLLGNVDDVLAALEVPGVLPIVPVAQTGFLVALRREEADRGAFDHFADELRDREAGATDERLGHGEEGAVGLRGAGKLVRRGERGAGSGGETGSARVRLSHPLFSGLPSPPAAAFSRLRAAPQRRKTPSLTCGPTFVTLRPWKRMLSASDSGPAPRRAKSDFLSVVWVWATSSSAATRS